MREVEIDSIPLERLAALLEPARVARLEDYTHRARRLLDDLVVWNISSTATGGGVAEMLQALLAYARGAEVDTRWLVLRGTDEFFRATKRLHNLLHGSPGDGGPMGGAERALYEHVLALNFEHLRAHVRPGDIVLLHDPQTAGLAAGLRELGAHVVWRCHVGRDTANDLTDIGWSFLRRYVEQAESTIFSREVYAPDWVPAERRWVIPPSLDPFSAKNREMEHVDVEAALRHTGIVAVPQDHGSLAFVRRNGSPGEVRPHSQLMVGGPVPYTARIVLQVSRWDRLKDMSGVIEGFAENIAKLPEDVHLLLAGPDVSGVGDDPEGAEVFAQCKGIWAGQPDAVRERMHLCSLPMDDTDENAHLVNAIQRYASVVVQKSLVEGFGLTVTEPMWKAKAVVASRVGGIQDQIEDGVTGLLLDEPTDLEAFVGRLAEVLEDPARGEDLGEAARERVRDRFLGDRHLIQYVDLFQTLLAG